MFDSLSRQLELGREGADNLHDDMGDPVLQRIAQEHEHVLQTLEDDCQRALSNLKTELTDAKQSRDLL